MSAWGREGEIDGGGKEGGRIGMRVSALFVFNCIVIS